MRGTLELHLLDRKARPLGQEAAWRSRQRQFLWEIVHDTRGVLRSAVRPHVLDLIRRVEAPGSPPAASTVLDASEALDAYAAVSEGLRALGAAAPRFAWIVPEDTQEATAACWFEENGRTYSLVGGWAAPVLRGGPDGTEPLRTVADDEAVVEVGNRRLGIRRQGFYDCFRQDLEGLIEALGAAAEAGLRVRFVQR